VKKELAENALFEVAEDTPSRVKQLTMREIDVLKLVRSGKSSQEIANELYVSPKTVEVHRHNILKKLNVKNTIELIFVTNNQIF
jgi:DNA-binding NarL/FixJ family response regulator